MAYSSGILNKRVTVIRRTETAGAYGTGSGGYTTETLGEVWANVTWSRGARAMREGTMDAYDSIMVRTRYFSYITRECLIVYDGATYVIDSLHADEQANTVQMTCTEIVM